MAFSFIVEMPSLTMMSRAKRKKAHIVQLNEPVLNKEDGKNKEMD